MKKAQYTIGSTGFPSVISKEGGSAIVSTSGAKGSLPPKGVTQGAKSTSKAEEEGTQFCVNWGVNNNFPNEVLDIVEKSTVGRAGLQYLTKMILGQEIFTYKRKGFDQQQRQIREYLEIPEWEEITARTNYDLVRIGLAQDYCMFSIAYADIVFNATKDKVYSISYAKARNTRLAPAVGGKIRTAYISANFPEAKKEDCEELPLIDPLYYPSQIEELRADKKRFRYLLPLTWPDARRDYYSLAYWDSSRSNGYMSIGNSIPMFKKALFANQMSIKYHIQVALEYWEWKYPNWNTYTESKQEQLIDDFYTEMVDSLTGAENAQKAIMTFYRSKTDGASKTIGEFKLDVIDDKMKSDAYLPDAAAADLQVLFSMLINPASNGLGSSSGAYKGGDTNGGSNIRESNLNSRSLLNPDRAILDTVFNFTKLYNGFDPAVRIATMDEVLTTLDTGAGTKKILS